MEQEAKFRADIYISLGECVRALNNSLSQDAHMARFRHVEAEEKPSKKSKKGGAKGSVALLKESAQLGCVSQDSYPRKSIPSNSPRALGTHKISGKKGSRGVNQECEPHERNPCAPRFKERTQDETLHQEKIRPQSSMGVGEKCLQAHKTNKVTFYSPIEAKWQRQRPLHNLQRNENSWLTLEHQCTC